MTLGPQLVLNTTTVRDYDGVREEIQCYLEKRQKSEPMAMDVDAFVKGKHSK